MQRLFSSLAFAALAIAHAGQLACESDDIALLQTLTDVKLHQQTEAAAHVEAEASEKQNPCACLDWKDVYTTLGVTCPSVNELAVSGAVAVSQTGLVDPAIVSTLGPMLGGEFCQNFYQHLSGTGCFNVLQGQVTTWEAGQWCYVDASCPQVSSTAKVPNTNVGWRMCNATDTLMRSKTPKELHKMAKNMDLDIGLTVKMAYPTVDKGMQMTTSAQIAMQATSTTPLVFDSNDHHPPFQVVMNGSVYLIEIDMANINMNKPSTFCKMTCTQGTCS